MSSKISEKLNYIKIKETNSINNHSKSLIKSLKNIYDVPVTTAMSSLLKDLSEKQRQLKKEIDFHRNTILEVEKKKYFLSSKMFPLIESRYSKVNLKNNFSKTDLNNETTKNKGHRLEKSKSEIRINFDNKIINKNIFKTSLSNSYKPIRINMSSISTPKTSINNQISTSKNNMTFNINSPINKETNKINYSSSTSLIQKTRRKNYKVIFIKGWEFKNGFNNNNNKDKSLVEDKNYQKNIISNQIEIIIDNTNFFKLKSANILEEKIKNNDINIDFLIKLNKIIEETAALYIEIGHLMILFFNFYFLSIKMINNK